MHQNGWFHTWSAGLARLVSERRRVRGGMPAIAAEGIVGADSNRWNAGRYLDVACSTAFDGWPAALVWWRSANLQTSMSSFQKNYSLNTTNNDNNKLCSTDSERPHIAAATYWIKLRISTTRLLFPIHRMSSVILPSVLWCCWLGGRKGIRPVKNWVVGCRVVLDKGPLNGCVLQWALSRSQNRPFPMRDLGPNLIYGCFGLSESTSQMASR